MILFFTALGITLIFLYKYFKEVNKVKKILKYLDKNIKEKLNPLQSEEKLLFLEPQLYLIKLLPNLWAVTSANSLPKYICTDRPIEAQQVYRMYQSKIEKALVLEKVKKKRF